MSEKSTVGAAGETARLSGGGGGVEAAEVKAAAEEDAAVFNNRLKA